MLQSVTNKQVATDSESHKEHPDTITKCPFGLIRNKQAREVVLTLRDPRDVVTSRSHPKRPGHYVFGWEKDEGWAPYGLKPIWEAAKRYLDTAHIVEYTRLISHPDDIQEELGQRFNLEYDRKFSQWPDGYKVKAYWELNGLGPQRPLESPRSWRDSPKDIERVNTLMDKHKDFRACVEELCEIGVVQVDEVA